MSLPDWLARELDTIGAQNAERSITRAEAVTMLRDAIIRSADTAFRLAITAEFAARQLDAWHRARRAAGFPAAASPELFPDLPARLYVRPGVLRPVALMDGHDWDMASTCSTPGRRARSTRRKPTWPRSTAPTARSGRS